MTEPTPYLECPCCGNVGAEPDKDGLYNDGQPLDCGCRGWVSVDCENHPSICIAWATNPVLKERSAMTEPREPVDLTAIRARIVSGQADDDEVESIIDALLALVRQKDAALEKIARSADEYLEYLHGTGSLGADEFQILKGRTITLACGARAALALSRDERTR